jgi:hypothetical protein
MNTIENIREQVEAKTVFYLNENTTIQDLDSTRDEIERKNADSLEAMKNSGFFTSEEVREVAKIAASILYKAHFNAVQALTETRRANWVF